MGHITSLFAWKFIRHAPESLDRAELLRSAGVDLGAPEDPALMIADTVFFDLIERIANAGVRGRTSPIRVGASMRCDD